jgi:hypothetical protein
MANLEEEATLEQVLAMNHRRRSCIICCHSLVPEKGPVGTVNQFIIILRQLFVSNG